MADRLSVAQIDDAIARLSSRERGTLFARLCKHYQTARSGLGGVGGGEARPWDDARNGFGPAQARLLRFLDGRGCPVHEREAIELLYDHRLTGHPHTALRARLRQLAKRTNDRLLRLRLGWSIRRPQVNHLWLSTLT